MKSKFICSGVLFIFFAVSIYAQVITLPEVSIVARNFKYLASVDNPDLAQPVKLLEAKAAAFDVQSSDVYEENNKIYHISFYLPQGYVLAEYDASGKLISTVEKFKNIAVPLPIMKKVNERFPNWVISKDLYLVKYEDESGVKRNYKLTLTNGNKKLLVKVNDDGEFLD